MIYNHVKCEWGWFPREQGGLAVRAKQNTFKIKTYHSSQCDYPSLRNSNLTSHFKFHSGEKPKQCNVT